MINTFVQNTFSSGIVPQLQALDEFNSYEYLQQTVSIVQGYRQSIIDSCSHSIFQHSEWDSFKQSIDSQIATYLTPALTSVNTIPPPNLLVLLTSLYHRLSQWSWGCSSAPRSEHIPSFFPSLHNRYRSSSTSPISNNPITRTLPNHILTRSNSIPPIPPLFLSHSGYTPSFLPAHTQPFNPL